MKRYPFEKSLPTNGGYDDDDRPYEHAFNTYWTYDIDEIDPMAYIAIGSNKNIPIHRHSFTHSAWDATVSNGIKIYMT